MLGWHVERFEVVVVVLRLWSLQNLEPETSENLFDFFPKDRERMAMAHGGRTAGQRDINRAGRLARDGKLRARRDAIAPSISCLRVLALRPRAGRWSAGAVATDLSSAATAPRLRPR